MYESRTERVLCLTWLAVAFQTLYLVYWFVGMFDLRGGEAWVFFPTILWGAFLGGAYLLDRLGY